ncbi:MAG: lysophospholipid acyltransferase family protein [Chloroherpetonaceae bacterium]|nr:lysophospholipid acyltransferase family protein [Chthonomonadaceae bacterium]MDW8207345.1 lysophospholipid acyltransferase family protein [Chloroherpetonaceae bacterium]
MSESPSNTQERTPLRKRLERAAGRLALRMLVTPLRALPLSVNQKVGRLLGGMLYYLLGRYRRVALMNLQLVFGQELTPAERRRMARRVFQHFGAVATEFVKLPGLRRDDLDRLVTVDGLEHLEQAYQGGRGVLLITGHFGNWEVLARWLTTHGHTLTVVARRANDAKTEELLRGTREKNGVQIVNRGGSAREILRALQQNTIVGILPDQNDADVFVPFFGLPTGTVDGPAQIHLRTGAPLLFAWCVRAPDNRFHVTLEPPEVIPPTGDRQADVERVMTLVNARLEAQIRRYPEQWLWLHHRWKASPGVFADGAEQARRIKMPSNRYKQEIQGRHER